MEKEPRGVPSLPDFPRRLTVEATNRCNLGCAFCPRHIGRMPLGDMSWELFTKLIDEAALHLPVAVVLFFRGESLLHRDLFKMMAYARERGLGPVQLASNGQLLNEAAARAMLGPGRPDFISFSLDTLDDILYSQGRPGGDLRTATDNVLNFIRLAEAQAAKGLAVPQIQVSSVDVEAYRARQEEFVAFWRRHADRVRVYIEHSGDGHAGSLKDNAVPKDGPRRPCLKLYSDMVIYWNGTAALCNHDWHNNAALGDLNSRTIADIWHSRAYQEMRAAHETGRPPQNSTCAHCDHWRVYYLPEAMLGALYEKI